MTAPTQPPTKPAAQASKPAAQAAKPAAQASKPAAQAASPLRRPPSPLRRPQARCAGRQAHCAGRQARRAGRQASGAGRQAKAKREGPKRRQRPKAAARPPSPGPKARPPAARPGQARPPPSPRRPSTRRARRATRDQREGRGPHRAHRDQNRKAVEVGKRPSVPTSTPTRRHGSRSRTPTRAPPARRRSTGSPRSRRRRPATRARSPRRRPPPPANSPPSDRRPPPAAKRAHGGPLDDRRALSGSVRAVAQRFGTRICARAPLRKRCSSTTSSFRCSPVREWAAPRADRDRDSRQLVFVDEAKACQRLGEVGAAVDQDRPFVVSSLQVRDLRGQVPAEDLDRSPIRLLQRAGEDGLRLLVHRGCDRPVGRGPVRAHDLVAAAAHRVDAGLLERAAVPLTRIVAEPLEHPFMGPVGAGGKTVEGHDHLENHFSIAHAGRDLPPRMNSSVDSGVWRFREPASGAFSRRRRATTFVRRAAARAVATPAQVLALSKPATVALAITLDREGVPVGILEPGDFAAAGAG